MMSLEMLLDQAPYSLKAQDKRLMLKSELLSLTQHHYLHCGPYQRILAHQRFSFAGDKEIYELPFLPVRLFKEYLLSSVLPSEVSATLRSSGTSGQRVSQITLDKQTAIYQKKVLKNIASEFLGSERLPLLVLDTPSVLRDRALFSARGAGILGFSTFGFDLTYAFDEKMNLNWSAINPFIETHRNRPVLLFGFTFMVWQYFCRPLMSQGLRVYLENGILIHGGGWKKLSREAIDRSSFRSHLKEVAGLNRVHDYYGMAEQTGSIFMECENGYFHCSNFSDVLIRRPDFSLCDWGEPGLIEVISVLPKSYPGHILLTEDEGVIIGEDNCPCGRLGKYFKVFGRIEQAETRGCSDTFEL